MKQSKSAKSVTQKKVQWDSVTWTRIVCGVLAGVFIVSTVATAFM